ncbi:MAG: thiamine pyrophosphate-dependent dehydrogenase E1 component subunit alpha [Candidatus Eisenbacteria bacterium]
MALPKIAQFYRSLYRIRRVEEEIIRIYPTDRVKSPVHLSIGQEAVSVGVCEALRQDDVVFGTYRGHALYLAKGGDLKKMMAELYGKVTGCARGKAGSMHLVDTASGIMGTSAIVSTTIPQSVGYGYALKVQGRDSLVASFFGDGAVDEGAFHESMNFAALKHVPVVFICENNLYAIHSHYLNRQPKDNICERVRTYGMPAERIEGNDVVRIYDRVKDAAKRIRSGASGPMFFECMTYRWREHVGPGEDWDLGYRGEDEAKQWIEGDQVDRLGAMLDPEARRRMEAEVETEIREAIEFAERSPFPDAEELYTDVFREC